MTNNGDEMAFETWWQDQYGKAMEFRDWQTCDNLHTAKYWQKDGFISGINHERKRSEKLLKCLEDISKETRIIEGVECSTNGAIIAFEALKEYNEGN